MFLPNDSIINSELDSFNNFVEPSVANVNKGTAKKKTV